MGKALIIMSFMFPALIANAQQVGSYSHYFYNPFVYNPAFTGSSDAAANAVLISRAQWNGFNGSPKLTIFTLDGSLIDKKIGLGFTLISDRKGITNKTEGCLSYSYRLNINSETHMMFGLSFGVFDQAIDFSKVVVENSADQNLFPDSQHKISFDGNAGMVFVWKELELGAAVPQILANKVKYIDNTINVRGYYEQARHYMASLKYKFFIAKEKGISIAPQGLVRFVPNTPFQYDGNVTFDWYNKFWIGATYKSDYAVAANAGFCIRKQLCVGYSYDFVTGSIGKYSGMSHEIMINYRFGKNKKPLPEPPLDKIPEPDNTSAVYERSIDSLEDELAISQKKVKALADKLQKKSKGQNEKNKVSAENKVVSENKGSTENKVASENKGTSENKKIIKMKEDAESTEAYENTMPDLNGLIKEKLLENIESLLDNPSASSAKIQELRTLLTSFMESSSPDSAEQKNLQKQYKRLSTSKDANDVLVRGVVVLENNNGQEIYMNASITVTEAKTGSITGIYTPNPKTGKYILVLPPGIKYKITAVGSGYQTYSMDFLPEDKKKSYEVQQEIRLKLTK